MARAAIVVVPAFILSFFLREVKLRMESGLQAQAAERAAMAGAGSVVTGEAAAESDATTARVSS